MVDVNTQLTWGACLQLQADIMAKAAKATKRLPVPQPLLPSVLPDIIRCNPPQYTVYKI